MTTYIVYSSTNDAALRTANQNYNTALTGSGATVQDNSYLDTGTALFPSGYYQARQSFHSFDTSVIPDTEEIVDATINIYSGYPSGQTVTFGQRFYAYNWTQPLTASQWVTPTEARSLSLIANIDYLEKSMPWSWVSTGSDELINYINKTGTTEFVTLSNNFVDSRKINGTEMVATYSGNTSQKPYLAVYTTALSTMNVVGNASVNLPDGTQVSIRSNGAASPTITVQYLPIGETTWVSMGNLNPNFDKTIDGQNSLALTADTDGNFYIFGVKAGSTGDICAQAFMRQSALNWKAGTVMMETMPSGNTQKIRSITASYGDGGGSTPKPYFWLTVARGSGGHKHNFKYHVSGAGFVHSARLNATNIRNGYGSIFYGTNETHKPTPSCGVPAYVDSVALADNFVVVYAQHGKFGNRTVGGLSMIQTYNTSGQWYADNTAYLPIRASKLLAISPTTFAHVFDNDGKRLHVRFYNLQCQMLGEATVDAGNFWGGQIGTQWTAYYDKVSNLVRLYYVSFSSARSVNRMDISPTTFTGSDATTVETSAFGPASSVNTFLKGAAVSDERRFVIESANAVGTNLTTQVHYSAVGNKAPSGPSLTTRPNFDASSSAVFNWTFADSNPNDHQTKFELEISRVSDSVVAYNSGVWSSTGGSFTLGANMLTNGVNYQWRVRTHDIYGAVGEWSAYGTFATSATGTLTITSPATDFQPGIETDDWAVTWSYLHSTGATQTQRRVRLIRNSDELVLLDTGMQTTTSQTYTVAGMESNRDYRVEVSLINSSSVASEVATRIIAPYYSEPMTPEVTLSSGAEYVLVSIDNPTPTGDRPEVLYNDVYRRKAGVMATDADFIRIGTVITNGSYRDYAVKSNTAYDYKVVGRTEV